jgi:hypothetical protein
MKFNREYIINYIVENYYEKMYKYLTDLDPNIDIDDLDNEELKDLCCLLNVDLKLWR